MTNFDELQARTKHFFDIDMQYKRGRNNLETGRIRIEYSMKICGRFNMVAPVLIKSIYGISHRLALQHLNKLVEKGYLALYKTDRAIDGRLYVLTNAGASYASELLSTAIPFRSQSEPSRQINHNSISHDLMNAYILLRGVNNFNKEGLYQSLWQGFVSEREFGRIYQNNDVRKVDGLVRECDDERTITAIEIENSYKNKNMRQTILLKLLYSLNNGIYDKVFMFSQRQDIFDDIKRFHKQLFEELPRVTSKNHHQARLSEDNINKLKRSIIFRTKFCEELQSIFYP